MLRKLVLASALLAAGAAAHAGVDVGVSIGFSQPGVYGRVDIGRYPQPQLWAPAPVMVVPAPMVQVEPMYLWVPARHREHWRDYCGRYDACGRPVYFVQDGWYQRRVMAAGPPAYVYRQPPPSWPAPRYSYDGPRYDGPRYSGPRYDNGPRYDGPRYDGPGRRNDEPWQGRGRSHRHGNDD